MCGGHAAGAGDRGQARLGLRQGWQDNALCERPGADDADRDFVAADEVIRASRRLHPRSVRGCTAG